MLKRLSTNFAKLTFTAALSLSCSVASAAILSPNESISLSGTSLASEPHLAGDVVYENLVGFEVTDEFGNTLLTGSYMDRVIRSSDTDQLIFTGRIQDLVGDYDLGIYDWSVTGYSGYETDVEYLTDDIGDLGPDQATRSTDGDMVTYDYDIELSPPDASHAHIASDATMFDLSGTAFFGLEDFDSGAEYLVELNGIAAPSPVPLPAAFWLFGTGLIGLIGMQKQRRKA
jgi:hypothetical protein